MKIHCHICSLFVAEIKHGSQIRKGSVMICSTCVSKVTKPQGKKESDFTEILGDLFGKFGKK